MRLPSTWGAIGSLHLGNQARQMQVGLVWLAARGTEPGPVDAKGVPQPGSPDADFFFVSPEPGCRGARASASECRLEARCVQREELGYRLRSCHPPHKSSPCRRQGGAAAGHLFFTVSASTSVRNLSVLSPTMNENLVLAICVVWLTARTAWPARGARGGSELLRQRW